MTLKSLWAKLVSLFARKENPPPTTPPSTDTAGVSDDTVQVSGNPVQVDPLRQLVYDLTSRLGRLPTIQEVEMRLGHGVVSRYGFLKSLGVVFAETPKPAGEVDRSGFYLGGEGEGLVKVNTLENGPVYVYTYLIRPESKTVEVYVFGAEGTQLLEVNDQRTIGGALTIPVDAKPGVHRLAVQVKSIGGRIAAQVRQS